MKKPKYTPRQFARVTLKEILNFYPITETNAFNVARVTRSTWRRWLAGTSNPPPATVELIRIHALGEPPDPAFAGFRFVRGVLYDDFGREHTPLDIRAAALHRIHSHRYLALLKQLSEQEREQKENEKKPPLWDGQKPILKLVR